MLKISIITPSYNHAEFIERTIRSVADSPRDGFELEHIIVDGGSTDGTVEILKSFGDSIRWVSEKDGGQADALNKGLAMASGDIIGWVNSDDVFLTGTLAKVAKIFADEPSTMWLYGKVEIIDRDDRVIRRWITAYKNWRMRKFSLAALLAENFISQMGVFWRADAGKQVGEFRKDLHWTMDYDFWLRLARRWPGRFVDDYLAAFRWYPHSKSGAGFADQFREGLAVAQACAAGQFPLAIAMHRINVVKIVAAYTFMQMFRNIAGRYF